MIPPWRKIGTMNRHHWFGCGCVPSGPGVKLTPWPHRSASVQVGVSKVVVFGQGMLICGEATVNPVLPAGYSRIHGTYRAPMLIRTYGEGPITGLNEGCISIGEWVSD